MEPIDNIRVYCLKCKKFTDSIKMRLVKTKNDKFMLLSECFICHSRKYKFVSKSKYGKGFLNSLINKIPIEMHIPGYQYCGPGTKLDKRVARGDPGINELDRACKLHDIHYAKYSSTTDRYPADKELADVAGKVMRDKNSKFKDKLVASLVKTVMNTKMKLGM
jgi:Phospholipase A2-like domain